MKVQNDQQTADILNAARPRGRPSTGSAKSGAERQRAYRKRARGNNRANLNVMISAEARVSLDALARHAEVTLAEVLERLLIEEKNRIMQEIYATGTPEEQEAASRKFFGLK